MSRKVVHVALNGVTGRMGYRQHLVRSLLAIREQGGVRLSDGTSLYPELILLGRDEGRLRDIAERHGIARWSTDLDEVLACPDAAYSLLEFASGASASVNSSWAVRVSRRELVELHVDGTSGSAVAGLRNCAIQHRVCTPMPLWNPDIPDPIDYLAQWTDVPDNEIYDNGFKAQWELFLAHAVEGKPFPRDLAQGARGVQLAGLALESSAEGRRLEVPSLPL
jgi:predicted dehydrogenase